MVAKTAGGPSVSKNFAEGTVWTAFFVYNLLAFALQPVVGLAVDALRRPHSAATLGVLIVAAAIPLAALPNGAVYVAVVLCGLGNAVFHVGGGVLSLQLAPGKATPVGLFVAPGAAGLTAGILLGRAGAPGWPAVVLLAALAVALFLTPSSSLARGRRASRQHPARPGSPSLMPQEVALASRSVMRGLESTILLLLFVVGLRSFVGLALDFPWKGESALLLALTLSMVTGKAAGGLLADRFGWREVGVGALLVSTPLLALGSSSSLAGIVGVGIFSLTMPVTLVAVVHVLPRHEGFAFGLTCLALFIGAVPALAGWSPIHSAIVLLAAGPIAAIALWAGLQRILPRSTSSRLAVISHAAEGGRPS